MRSLRETSQCHGNAHFEVISRPFRETWTKVSRDPEIVTSLLENTSNCCGWSQRQSPNEGERERERERERAFVGEREENKCRERQRCLGCQNLQNLSPQNAWCFSINCSTTKCTFSSPARGDPFRKRFCAKTQCPSDVPAFFLTF